MYCPLFLATAFFTVALSGQTLAAGINSFSQAKTAGVKVNADVPGDFYCGCKINWQGKKGVVDLNSCGKRTRIAPAESNGNTSFRHGSLATNASAGRKVDGKTAPKIRSIAKWKATCITCNPPSVR